MADFAQNEGWALWHQRFTTAHEHLGSLDASVWLGFFLPVIVVLVGLLMKDSKSSCSSSRSSSGSSSSSSSNINSSSSNGAAQNPYASSNFKGLSLWLVPKPKTPGVFEAIIKKYAAKMGTGVTFSPHVTLLTGLEGDHVELARKCRDECTALRRFRCEVQAVQCKDLFFQSVFAVLEGDSLLDARKAARAAFGMSGHDARADAQDSKNYMPHVSLLYGDVTMAARREMKAEVEPGLKGLEIDIEELQLWSTEGDVKDWYMVHSQSLGVQRSELRDAALTSPSY